MHRTTVYLPDELREQLARAARADHRSEADIIREGVERVLRERSLSDQPPEPRLPLVESGHPGLGLALDWFFSSLPPEVLDWLVAECQSVWAEQPTDSPMSFTFRLSFRGKDGEERYPYVYRGPITKMAQTWADICWSLALWQRMVMDGRERLEGHEVLVIPRWDSDRPPALGAPPAEIAYVEVGPRVGSLARTG